MRVQTAGDAMSVLELPLMNKNTSVQDAFNDFVTTDYSAVVIKTSKVLSVLLVCVLAACNSSAPPAAATISNLTVFLVQGTPEQKSIDQVTYRKHDYPLPNGYQVDDSVLLPDGRILQTFAYPPFGPANFAKGDGGQIVSINGATVLFTETRDGGKPNDQYFVGPNCGGTGWVVFRNDAPTSRWATLVARLNDNPDPNACPSLKQAYTRYRLEILNVPFTVDGRAQTKTLPVIISEHYNTGDMGTASAMERSYFCQGWGLCRWEAWSTKSGPLVDLAPRNPDMGTPLAGPPAAGWRMVDVRHWTNIVSTTGFALSQYGWPTN
jgi:hypothetical protein